MVFSTRPFSCTWSLMQPVRKVQLGQELLDLWPEVSDASDDSGDDAYAQDGLLVLGRTFVLVAFGLIGAGELVVALFRAGLLVIRGVLVAVGGTREDAVVREQVLNACLDVGGRSLYVLYSSCNVGVVLELLHSSISFRTLKSLCEQSGTSQRKWML